MQNIITNILIYSVTVTQGALHIKNFLKRDTEASDGIPTPTTHHPHPHIHTHTHTYNSCNIAPHNKTPTPHNTCAHLHRHTDTHTCTGVSSSNG